jgi:hypothetical protein
MNQEQKCHICLISRTADPRPGGEALWTIISKGDLQISGEHQDAAQKRGAGRSCQCPALRGRKRCRLHGGLSPGAPRGRKNGNFKNGEWTAEAIEERRWLRLLVRAFAQKGYDS